MSVPNHQHVPRKLFDTGLFDLKTEEGQGAFTDACVSALHGLDERWGHLKKNPGQSDVHHHGEDSALYLSDTPGQSQAVDFIGGAGGANPQPGWIVDAPRYSAKDWADPTEHGFGSAPAPTPTLKPRDQFYREFQEVNGYYGATEGLKRSGGMVIDSANPVRCDAEAMGAWGYDLMTGKTVEQCKTEIRHSDEWKSKHPGETP